MCIYICDLICVYTCDLICVYIYILCIRAVLCLFIAVRFIDAIQHPAAIPQWPQDTGIIICYPFIHCYSYLQLFERCGATRQSRKGNDVCVCIYKMYPFIIIRIYSCTIYSGDAVSSDKCTRAIICICKYTYIYIYI
jgi:hypothetical protein